MFSKALYTATVCAVVCASMVFAASQYVEIVECQDHECKTDCKVVGRRPSSTCHADKFRKDNSMEAICAPAPAASCYYLGIFDSNSTVNACADANARMIDYHRCGECRESIFHKGFYDKSTCSSTGEISMEIGCDATCGNCKSTHKLQDKTCHQMKHNKAMFVMATAPAKCNPQLITSMWNASSDCEGPASFVRKMFQNTCYARARGGHHGKKNMESHYFHCA